MERRVGRTIHSAWTKFHKEAHRRRATWTAVGPENYIIMLWVSSALEEVEEQVFGLDINISRICAR